MDAPLLFLPAREASYVRVNDSRRKDGGVLLNDIYPLVPKGAAPLIGPLSGTTGKFLGAFRFPTAAGRKPSLSFMALMTHSESQAAVPLEYSLLSSQPKPDGLHILVEFRIPALEPGRYALECGAVDLASRARASVITRLEVR
jgi:hypothetical protein